MGWSFCQMYSIVDPDKEDSGAGVPPAGFRTVPGADHGSSRADATRPDK